MPDTKITALTAIGANPIIPATFPIPMVDLTDTSMAASGTTKKVTVNQILGAGGTATLASATITGALTGQSSASFYTGTALPLHIRNSGTSFTQIGDNGTIGAGTAFIVGSSDASLRFQSGGAEAGRINATGVYVLKGGTTSANGVGIAFPATQVASSDANTLDDYEEGTFTPAIIGTTTTGAGTYVDQSGIYTKVGRQVTIQIFLNWTAHTGTGNIRLAGLPFTSSNSFQSASVGYWNNIAVNASSTPMAYVVPSATTIELLQMPSGGGAMGPIPIDVSGGLMISATYFV